MQHTMYAVSHSTLQHTATHCNTLQLPCSFCWRDMVHVPLYYRVCSCARTGATSLRTTEFKKVQHPSMLRVLQKLFKKLFKILRFVREKIYIYTYQNSRSTCIYICIHIYTYTKNFYTYIYIYIYIYTKRFSLSRTCAFSRVLRDVGHVRMSHVTHVNGSCRTYEWDLSHIWMSHVTHMDESCHPYEWVIAHVEWVLSHIWMSHVPHVHVYTHVLHESWVMSHIWMSHVTHMNEWWNESWRIPAQKFVEMSHLMLGRAR